jgi:hypothetical protein
LSRAIRRPGHAVVNGWNIEWHLSDGRISDILIDPATNLPLFQDFVCTSEEQTLFGSEFMNSVCMPCEKTPGDFDHYDCTKALLCCTSVTDETNQYLSDAQRELIHWH